MIRTRKANWGGRKKNLSTGRKVDQKKLRNLRFCSKLIRETPPLPQPLLELVCRKRFLWIDLEEIASRGNKKKILKTLRIERKGPN